MDLSGLNNVQREAVECSEGASMIIAGAGSGKTRVLTYKIAALIEKGAAPSSIIALTFTNKAAKEMKERIATIVGSSRARALWMGTFHSIFSRILREYAELLGFPKSFTIYDASDAKNAIKMCIKELQLDDKVYKPNEVLSRISTAKNYMVTAEAYAANQEAIRKDMQSRKGRICDVYTLYAKKCKAEGVMDFDDILLYTNILLKRHPEALKSLQESISYILVDEYQDTNMAQYNIVRMLAAGRRNITVVGDDSQSIYAFRGARIQNILNFRRDYPEAKEFRLEQNYRSTRTIVDAANSVIEHNENRLKKKCFSEGEEGEKIELIHSYNEQEEAANVVSSIMRRIYASKASYDSFAILYRTNSQSRTLEEALRKRNVPYIIYAGHSFYERKEVKNILAYFRLVLNPKDNEAFRRIVNVPARGIGGTTLGYLSDAAAAMGVSMMDAIGQQDVQRYGVKDAALNKLRAFAEMIGSFSAEISKTDAYTMASKIAEYSGLLPSMRNDLSVEGVSALGNVTELLNSVAEFAEKEVETAVAEGNGDYVPTLDKFVENVALLTDSDKEENEEDDNRVRLMTAHASKGLEFPYIYITGMEENLFPSAMSGMSNDSTEEERRLFYVALTRAEKAVSLSYADTRFINGKTSACRPSRFLREIDPRYLNGIIEEVDIQDEDDSDEGWGGWNRRRPGRSFDADREGSGGYGQSSAPRFVRRDSSAPASASTAPRDMSRLRKINKPFAPNPALSASGGASMACDFNVNDRVSHQRFGSGTVLKVSDVDTDARVIVKFDNGETRTLLIKFAKLTKLV